MADVFLSYSSADRAKAALLERALTDAGYSVFWDQETPPGEDWDSWIRGKLGQARAVVVLWSKTSIASPNVRHEAMVARDARQLIPVMIEPLKPSDFPMGLYLVQGVVLDRWRGDPGDPAFQRLLAEIAARSGPGARPAAPAPQPRRTPWAILAGVALVAVLGVGGYLLAARKAPPAEASDQVAAAAHMLVGRWHWTGIACGEGPSVTRDGDTLLFAMAGTPTYRHAIASAGEEGVRTLVVEPEAERGADYLFTRNGDALAVKTLSDNRVDEWEACP